MRRVSYQSVLGESRAGGTGVYVRLGEAAIGTRNKDARGEITVALAAPQLRWLKEAIELSGPAIDQGTVVRALVDLGMELDIDWAVLARGKSLRAAVRQSVMVHRRTGH